jgi:ParB/RepB/Spo0J family partition protein
MPARSRSRAFDAFLPDVEPGRELDNARALPLGALEPNPWQPRRAADPARLQELADDIAARGVLEPLLVRKVAEGRYQVIAGERRYRAAGLAGRDMIPCLILEVDEAEARAISLVENLQREDLDIEDEARFFKELHDAGLSLRAIADVIHKSHNYVNRRVKLAADPDALLAYREGLLNLNRLVEAQPEPADDVPMDELAAAAQAAARELLQAGEIVPPGNSNGADHDEDATRAGRARVVYKPFHKFVLHVRRVHPETIPPDERPRLRRTVDDLINELTALARALDTEAG